MASEGSTVEEYWDDDFRPLNDASKAVAEALELDENSPESDLYRRLASSGSASQQDWTSTEPYAQAHAYHNADGDSKPVTLKVRHESSKPLPEILMQAKRGIHRATFMGVLSPLGWGYMTADSSIFLFSLNSDSTGAPETLLSFDNPSKQSIITAQVVKPRPGVFKSIVEYCLVVSTVEEVLLLALAKDELGAWNCVPTSFVVSSDSIKLTAIAGSSDGRIFLGGEDGSLHEFVYENTRLVNHTQSIQEQLDNFYESAKDDTPAVITEQSGKGKRSYFEAFSSSVADEPPHKYQKKRRDKAASNWSPWQINNRGGVIEIAVDDERQTLSLITQKGFLEVYDMRGEMKSVATCHLPPTIRSYLDSVRRGQMTPSSSSKSLNTAEMRYPGGLSAAQGGVGGMAGASSIVRDLEQSHRNTGRDFAPALFPVKLSVISCRESAHLTLLVVTKGGLRLYLSTLESTVLNTGAVGASQTTTYLRNPKRSPLAPSRLTLCHIRAPPSPTDTAHVSKPGSQSTAKWEVDASFHYRGQCLLAVEEKSNPGEDLLLSMMPDSVARVVPEDDTKKTPQLKASGGLAETMSLPCDGRTLKGGKVWEFCKLPWHDDSGLFDLLWKSSAPPNANDLDIPAPYYAPSLGSRSNGFKSQPQLPAPNPPPRKTLRATAVQVMSQAFLNFVTFKPLSHGMTVPSLTNGPVTGPTTSITIGDAYRVSSRTGVEGFSITAAEKSGYRSAMSRPSSLRTHGSSSHSRSPGSSSSLLSPKVSKSARLQKHLLRPMTIPLSHFATQHLESGDTQIVAVNANGVHTFSIESIMSALGKAIMSAGELVAEDSLVTKFFQSYGYAEGCAMGLALAIGCGPSKGIGPFEKLRELAIRAVMARAYRPKIKRSEMITGANTEALPVTSDSSSDPFVPPGYEFRASSLSQGLMRLFSRLVRPVWNKPLIVVTEGRAVKSHWSHRFRISPAKVEMLLDDRTLSDVRAPLQSLLRLTKDVFKRAIEQVPGVVQRQESSMDIDDGMPQRSSFLTQALHYRSNSRAGTAGTVVELSPKDAENIAHLIEERNIHSLYRLLSRSVQLLNLLVLLRSADSMAELPQIDWGLLHGLTFCQLAKSREGQERIESLLNSLIVASAASEASVSYSAQANNMAQEFATNCYLFYPPASRFAYNGIRFAMEALACAPSGRRADLVAQASSNLTDAARQWQSATLISGRLLRSRGNESHSEIVARALEHGSPLAKAVELLVQLEAVACVVEICLLTAANFQNRRSKGHIRGEHNLDGVLGWERDLYHKNRDAGHASSSGTGTSESIGASVTEKDAIDTCYAIILHHLSTLLVSNPHLAYRMVSACTSYSDKQFLNELFTFLHDKNHTDVLLRISSADVEKWLRERSDMDLLWRYYDIQGKKYESAKVSFDRATSKGSELSIEKRIECLAQASNSLRESHLDANRSTSDESSRLQIEVNDFLVTAKIQHRILRAIESSPDIPESISNDNMIELKSTLLDISKLYEIASSVPLTDLCLVIYHNCQQNDSQAIAMLWTTLLGEQLLPMAAHRAEALSFLRKLATDVRREDAVEDTGGGVSRNAYRVFEDGGWIAALSSKIQMMGHELYGTGADYTFPVDFLMDFLERLRKACPAIREPSWALTVLADANIPYLSLIQSYKTLSLREERFAVDANSDVVAENLSAQLGLLSFWMERSTSGGGAPSSAAKQELSRAHATGELQSYLDYLHSKISVTPGVKDMMDELKAIEENLSYLV